MKRFWQHATAEPDGDHWAIRLDGKPMRLPGGAELHLTHPRLAEAIAAEWQGAGANGGQFTQDDVPLTRLAGTAQDRIAPDTRPVADGLALYAETDVLCYRAGHPLRLVVRQAREWQPWLDWLETAHGARLLATEGVGHFAQDPVAIEAVRTVLRAQPALVLAALGIAIPALGSVVLGLALAEGVLDSRRAYELSNLDELYQVEHWGEDTWAARRRTDIASDIALAERLIGLVRAG